MLEWQQCSAHTHTPAIRALAPTPPARNISPHSMQAPKMKCKKGETLTEGNCAHSRHKDRIGFGLCADEDRMKMDLENSII